MRKNFRRAACPPFCLHFGANACTILHIFFIKRGRQFGGTKGAATHGGGHCLHTDAAAGAQYQPARAGRWFRGGQCVGAGAGKLCGCLCGRTSRLGAQRTGPGRCPARARGGRAPRTARKGGCAGPYAGALPGILSAVCGQLPGRTYAQNRRAGHDHPLGVVQPAHRHAGLCAAALCDAAGGAGICGRA